ncbi:PAS domain-containing protein [Piscinibacter sakaiensis]|uniref:PAS domain-containing protein n=1 Tax=Piscinibacter sakaiensis TaxID=1547922 RepID=UPI003AAB52D4
MTASRPWPQAIAHSNELLALLGQSREWQLVSDAAGRLLWANRAFDDASGAPAAGTALAALLSTDPQSDLADETLRQSIGTALQRGLAIETTATLDLPPRLLGVPLQVRISAHADLRLWTLSDLRTERSQQQRLRQLEELLGTAQEFGRLGVWERDLATGKGRWDDHVFRFWGLDPADGTPDFDEAIKRIHPDDVRVDQFARSTRQIGRYAQRFRVVRPDGSMRWLHSQWEIKPSADGQPAHAVGVMVDDTESVTTAHSLKEASAKLTFAVELGEIVIFQHDLQSNRIHFNSRGQQMFGLPDDADGTPIERLCQLIHPDDRAQATAAFETALSKPGPVDMQARYRCSDGSWRYLLSRRVLQRDALERPLSMVGVALDVSERVKQEYAAAELARRLEIATSAAGVGIWSRDPDGAQVHWNGQMFRLCGWSPDLGPPSTEVWLAEVVHPDDRVAVRAALVGLQRLDSGAAEYEYRVVRPAGEVRWLVDRVRRESSNGHPMLFGATLDVTERRATDQALAQARERSALATHGAGIGTWETELSGELARWDAQMYMLRGLDAPADLESEAARQPWTAQAHPDDLPRIRAAHQRSLSDGSMARYEFRIVRPDGALRWLAARSVPVRDAQGNVSRVLGVNWDIHERVVAEEVRREAQAAQRRSDARSELLAHISHELRTPLNAILGFTQLLAGAEQAAGESDRAPTTAGSRLQMLSHIRNAAEQLLELVDEVLDLSTVKPSEPVVALKAVDLEPLLRGVATAVNGKSAARAPAVHFQPPADAVAVLADEPRLRRLVSKLLGQQQSLASPASAIGVSASADQTHGFIDIERAGTHSAPARQAELFDGAIDRALVAKPAPAPDLRLFAALLAVMNGRLDESPLPGGGERLRIVLPRAQLAAASETGGCAARVLYIEDNPVNVILVQELIARRGRIEFLSEGTGLAGVDRAAVFRPDLVLIDIHLPDIDGFEVLRRLREQAQTRATSCVALSANAIPEDIERAKAAGFDDYWTKPIRFEQFLGGLDRLLAQRAAR